MRYEISGTVMQTVSIDLSPGERIVSQTHAMAWMSDGITMDTHTGGGLFAGLKRALSGGSVFITVSVQAGFVEILIEDDGRGIPEADRIRIFDRGVRLDTGKPGTGLGLAIVRDVAEIYDGTVTLEESEDLGGLLVRLRLPAAG